MHEGQLHRAWLCWPSSLPSMLHHESFEVSGIFLRSMTGILQIRISPKYPLPKRAPGCLVGTSVRVIFPEATYFLKLQDLFYTPFLKIVATLFL